MFIMDYKALTPSGEVDVYRSGEKTNPSVIVVPGYSENHPSNACEHLRKVITSLSSVADPDASMILNGGTLGEQLPL